MFSEDALKKRRVKMDESSREKKGWRDQPPTNNGKGVKGLRGRGVEGIGGLTTSLFFIDGSRRFLTQRRFSKAG